MGLFRRGKDKDEATTPGERPRPHSHVALAPEDAEDAKRCEPAVSLEGFAAARGLTFGGSCLVSALVGVQPWWQEYVFNSCRGVVSERRFGLVEHELLEIPVDPNDDSGSGISSMSGEFWAVRRGIAPGQMKRLIPGAIEMGWDEPKNEPFAAYATWAPVTTVAVHVPEAAMVPRVSVATAGRIPGWSNRSLEDVGAPGFELGSEVDDATLAALFAGGAGDLLTQVGAPYVALKLHHAQLALTRNGFVGDEAELDRLIALTAGIADAMAAGLRPGAVTSPCSVELAPPAPETGRLAGLDGWDATFEAVTKKFGLVREDPAAYHAAFPRLPVPGTARGVFRGALPAGGAHGRLAFHEHGGLREGSLRGAAVFAAPEGASPTPPGGVLHERTDMVVGVGEGVAACWNRVTEHGVVSVTPTAEKAQATLRELGLLG